MQVKKYLLVILTTSITISVVIPYSYAEEQITGDPSEIVITQTELRPSIQKKQEELRKKMAEQKAEFQEQMKQKREEIEKEIAEKVKTKNESFQASREAFMQKMKTIRDEKKQEILEKLDTMMNDVNKKQTDSLAAAVVKLSGILDEMEKKADAAKTSGENTSSFDTALTTARAAISDAKVAIATQTAQEYIINIASEEALRASVGTTRKQLEMDLKTTRESVRRAKGAVRDAARELSKIRKNPKLTVTPVISATPTATLTTTP